MSQGHDHYLPAMHLRGFSFDERRTWQLDTRSSTIRPVSVRDAGVARGLNTIRDGSEVDRTLESVLSFDENSAAPILARLRETVTGPLALPADQNAALSRYAAVLYMRSPHQRSKSQANARALALEKAVEFSASGRFARMIARAGLHADPLQVEVVRLRYLVQLRDGKMPVHAWPIAVGIALRRAGFIAAMRKFVVRHDGLPFLVCGDGAVILMRDNAYYAAGDLGFGSFGVRVVIPISPSAFLLFARVADDALLDVHWGTAAFASFVNRASVQHTTRFLFGRDPEHLTDALEDFKANQLIG